MTGAELRTLREALGLPVRWLAEQFNVDPRTVTHWETERNSVPSDVAELLIKLDMQFDQRAEEVLAEAQRHVSQESSVPFMHRFIRHKTEEELWAARPEMAALSLPVACHAVQLFRAWKLFKKHGYGTDILYHEQATAPTYKIENPPAQG